MGSVDQVEIIKKAFLSVQYDIPAGLLEKFELYRYLLLQWNQKINLISRPDEDRIVCRHFLESVGLVTVLPFASNVPVLDIGTGAGFPGLPVKLVMPDLELILVESRKKKVLFLKEVIDRLNLKYVSVLPVRIEDLDPFNRKVLFVSRAVAPLDQLYKWIYPLTKEYQSGIFAMKGPNIKKEVHVFNKRYPFVSAEYKTYNPFPEVYPLKDHYIASIQL